MNFRHRRHCSRRIQTNRKRRLNFVNERDVRQFPGAFARNFRFKVPECAVQGITCRTRRQQLLNLLPIQMLYAFDGFDLRQNRGRALVITSDRGRFTTSYVLSVGHGHDDDTGFRASTAGNAKRFIQRPALFLCVECEVTGVQIV